MPPSYQPLHKDVQIRYMDKRWLPIFFPAYHVVMLAPIDIVTATANLERLNGTTVEYRLYRSWLGRPGNDKVKYKSWMGNGRLLVEGPRTFQGGQLHNECSLTEIDDGHTALQITSRLTNDGLALLVLFYVFVFVLTVVLGMSGHWVQILIAWLMLSLFYLFQMQYLRWSAEEAYNFVSNWLMQREWVMPPSRLNSSSLFDDRTCARRRKQQDFSSKQPSSKCHLA